MTMGTILGCAAVGLSLLNYILQKSSSVKQDTKIENFESNCIVTLQTQVVGLIKQDELFREDIKEIYKQIDDLSKDLQFLKGKLNGG